MNSEIERLRENIDQIDSQLVDLVKRRLDTVAEIAAAKKSVGSPVLDASRERQLLNRISRLAGEDHEALMRVVFVMLMDVSRSYQHGLTRMSARTLDEIDDALAKTPQLFPERAVVSCQGIEGAYSQIACDKLFAMPEIMYSESFEGVFKAVESGLCAYGVIPIENSLAGSVVKIYDLLGRYNVKIVRSTRLHISHSLLALPGVRLEDIREVISHDQALAQCEAFLDSLKGVKVTAFANTAVAARQVAESGRRDLAAIASKEAADNYSLSVLAHGIQGNDGNFTRFVCLAPKLEIYPGANRSSLLMELPNKPGALYRVLVRFYALGINMIKLESRPIPGSSFSFRFYVEVDAPVYSPAFKQLVAELENELDGFSYLGSYQEMI